MLIIFSVHGMVKQAIDSIIEVVHDDWFLFVGFLYYSLACDVQYNCIAGARIEETCSLSIFRKTATCNSFNIEAKLNMKSLSLH